LDSSNDDYITGKELVIEFGKFLIWYCIVFVISYRLIGSSHIVDRLLTVLVMSGFSFIGYKLAKKSKQNKQND